MKKLFLLLFFLFCTFGEAALTDSAGRPSEPLLELLTTFEVCHDGSWDSIDQATQKAWLRKENQELWEVQSKEDPDPEKTYRLFTQLDMTQTLYPPRCEYDYALILGASANPVRQRYQFLREEWEKGLRFKQLVILTGDRPLVPELDHVEGGDPKNETEMMRLLFEQTDLPSEWRSMVLFIDAPKQPGKRRPDTMDTYLKWLSMEPNPGTTLIISTQPFILRQTCQGSKILPHSFRVDPAGPGFSLEMYQNYPRGLSILLDELARRIHTYFVAPCSIK